ncbi:MAG: non-canonical purine NTP pyrophosphatase, partial [Clostridiales bacterium]|nr:non-canonical purine NTP pyrophosphatase [Clostridiales bacterium]
ARYAGDHGNDEKNIDKLLKNLEGVEAEKRTARFVSAVCCVFPDGREFTVRGECEGLIAFERHGNGGFGYDPVFMVDGVSFGELSAEQKDKLSHRGNALRKLAEKLPQYLEK